MKMNNIFDQFEIIIFHISLFLYQISDSSCNLDIQPESYLGMKMASRREQLGKGSLEHSPFPVRFTFEL